MKYHCKTDAFRYVVAGRSELGRDDSTHEQLAGEYCCSPKTIAELSKCFRENRHNFRKLAIEATIKHYKEKGIQFSAESVRAYLLRRRKKYGHFDIEGPDQSLKALEERLGVALRNFQGDPLKSQMLQDIISRAIEWIALQDFQSAEEGSKVASALQAINDELDRIDPRPVDQIGTAPSNFHETVYPAFKLRELWFPDSFWCNLNNGRPPRFSCASGPSSGRGCSGRGRRIGPRGCFIQRRGASRRVVGGGGGAVAAAAAAATTTARRRAAAAAALAAAAAAAAAGRSAATAARRRAAAVARRRAATSAARRRDRRCQIVLRHLRRAAREPCSDLFPGTSGPPH